VLESLQTVNRMDPELWIHESDGFVYKTDLSPMSGMVTYIFAASASRYAVPPVHGAKLINRTGPESSRTAKIPWRDSGSLLDEQVRRGCNLFDGIPYNWRPSIVVGR
jgi:hypothetical protein